MLFRKALFFAILLFVSITGFAQRANVYHRGKSMYTQKRFNNKAPRVRGEKAKIVCPIFEHSKYPFHGFGFKLGDPFSLSYKFYPTKKLSFVADVGKPASSLYNRYYREKFVPTSPQAVLVTHKVISDIVGELKILYSIDVEKISPGLQMYLGGGWQWKRTTIQYDFTIPREDFTDFEEFQRFRQQRYTMGPQLIMGIEYAYFHIPISAFMELEYFSDILADPGYYRLEGGVGLRYIF